MKCMFAVAFAVILVVVAEGRPDTTQTQTETVQPLKLEDYINQAKTQLDTLSTQIKDQLSLPNQEDFVNKIKEQTNTLADNVRSYINTMSEEIKNKRPEVEQFWTNVQNRLTEMANNLNVNPETTKQLSQLRETFEHGVQTIISESETAAKNINVNSAKVQDGVAEFVKQAVDLAVQASQNLSNQLKPANTETTA